MHFRARNAHNACNFNLCYIWWISKSCTLNKIFGTHWILKAGSYIFHILLSREPCLYSVRWKTNSKEDRIYCNCSNTAVLVMLQRHCSVSHTHISMSVVLTGCVSCRGRLFNSCNVIKCFLTLLRKWKCIWISYSFGWILKVPLSIASIIYVCCHDNDTRLTSMTVLYGC